MSIMRCERHDRNWDSDKLDDCPLCENEQEDEMSEELFIRCDHCDDGTEPHTDNDVTGPQACSKCLGNRFIALPAGVEEPEIIGWLEHHKGGDNLNWGRVDHPYAKAEPLIKKSAYDELRSLLATPERDAEDAKRWRFGVEHGFPHLTNQIYPEFKRHGWRTPSQEPANGVVFNPDDYPYYPTAEAAIDAARKDKP